MKPHWSVLMIPTNFKSKERATSFFQVNPFSQLTAGTTACMRATDFPLHFDLRQAGKAFAAGVPRRAQSGSMVSGGRGHPVSLCRARIPGR